MAATKFVPLQPPERRSRVTRIEQGSITAVNANAGRKDLDGVDIKIEMVPSVVSNDPFTYRYLIYGPKGAGKTKLSSMFAGGDHVYFLMFEKLAEHLSIRQSFMDDQHNIDGTLKKSSWLVAEAYLEFLISNPSDISLICCDGLRAMYAKAFYQGCREAGVDHPGGQNDFGKSWDKVKKTFNRFVERLVHSRFGLVFNCHDIQISEERFINGRIETQTQIIPNLPKEADEFVRHLIDNVFYLHFRGYDRWLQIRPDQMVYASCKSDNHFFTRDGEPIYMIPMGKDASEGYTNFIKAFNNEQEKAYKEITREDILEVNKAGKGNTTIKRIREKKGQ